MALTTKFRELNGVFQISLFCLKGHCHGLICAEFKSAKTHFTAMETYKYWSSFDKNYNASVMKLKKMLYYCDTTKSSRSELEKVSLIFSSFVTMTVSL